MTACPLCKGKGTSNKYVLKIHRIAYCEVCNFLFNQTFAEVADAAEMFSEPYYKNVQEQAFASQFVAYEQDPSIKNFSKYLAVVESHISGRNLLDVGSALGTFMKVGQERGWSVYGAEISKFATDYARDKYGFDIFNGDLSENIWADEFFDVITFWDSIEHVRDPRENIEQAYRLLKRNGLMLFTTDNFDCLLGSLAEFLYSISFGMFRYPMERLFIRHNRSYFNEKNFKTLLGSYGMQEVYFEKIEYPLEKINTNVFENSVLKAFYALQNFLNKQAQFVIIVRKV